MPSKIVPCSCQNTGATAVKNRLPLKMDPAAKDTLSSKSPCNFEIIRFKPLKERLLHNDKHPTFTRKYMEDIKGTLRESCNFECIDEVLYYLEMNPYIHDIVPELLEFISCELKKEDQQRTPILLKALYCLYTNSVSDLSDFSVCTNALEHFLTKSSTFPGDYVLKDLAADLLSDFCATSPSDDLREHINLQLSRVFHNPNWHSYNLYGGIVGCLSNMSVKSGPEVVPYDEFNSDTFLRHVLSSPKMLKKLYQLCKPFIYSYLPSKLIPRPLHNKNSFYDVNTNCASVFNLLRNERVTPMSHVKYDRKYSADYQFDGGYFDDAKWSNLSADCQEKDLIWPGFSAFQMEKMLDKNTESETNSKMDEGSIHSDESERNLETDGESDDGTSSSESLQNSQTGCKSDGCLYFNRSCSRSGHKSDGYVMNFKKKNPDFDRCDYTKMWLDKYGGNAERSENEMNPLVDRRSDDDAKKSKKRKYLGFDRKYDYTNKWLDKYGGYAKCSKSETNPLAGTVSDGCVGTSNEMETSRGELHKQNIQNEFSEGDTDSSKSEENIQIKNERKLRSLNRRQHQVSPKKTDVEGLCQQDIQSDFLKGNTDVGNSEEDFQIKNKGKLHYVNLRQLQVSLKKIDWKFDEDPKMNPQVDDEDKSDINSSKSEDNMQIENSDLNSSRTEINSYIDCKPDKMDIDEVKNLQDENESSDVKNSQSESNLQTESKSDDHADITDWEKNLQHENKSSGEVKNSESERNVQIESKSDGNIGITDREKNLQDDNKSNEGAKNSESEMHLPFYIIYDSKVDGKTGISDCERNLQDDHDPVDPECSESTGDMDISDSERNLQPGLNDSERSLQDDSNPSERIKNEEMMSDVDSRRAKKRDDRPKTKSSEPPDFRSHVEYLEYLAWKRDRSYSDTHRWNKICETVKLIPPPAHIDRSVFQYRPADDLAPDTHVISSEYIPEESATARQRCCEISDTFANPFSPISSRNDADFFKNLDKKVFADWKFKKPKAAKKESLLAEKSETRSPLQKKCKTRGGKKR